MSAVPHHEPAPPMSEPCFQCGEDPGAEQRCVHCGAPRVVPAAALFSTGGEPDIPAPPPAPPPPPPPRVETPPPLPRPSFQPDPGPRPTGAGLFTAGTSEEANGQTEWAEPSFGIGDAGEAPVFGIEDPLVDDDIADAEIIEDDGDMAIVADAPPEPVPAMFSAAAPPAADGYPAPGAPSEESETAEESAPAEPAVDSAGDGEAGLAVDAEPQVELDGDAAPDEARVSDDVAAATLGAIFAAPPDRTDDNPAARSPFGQFANDPDPTTVGRWSTVDPEVEPIDAAAERARRRRAAAAERAEPVDTPSYVTPPTIAPPPAYRSATPTPPVPAAPAAISSPAASAPFAEWQVEAAAAGSPTTPEPDDHGLAGAVHRLSSNALQQATVALSVAGALLDENESVVGAVTGSSLGLPAAVVVTTDRVLVVIDRRWVPQVERFSLTPSLHVHGRHHQGAATLTFSDRERLITVDHIVDVAVAIEVANTVRSLAAGSEF